MSQKSTTSTEEAADFSQKSDGTEELDQDFLTEVEINTFIKPLIDDLQNYDIAMNELAYNIEEDENGYKFIDQEDIKKEDKIILDNLLQKLAGDIKTFQPDSPDGILPDVVSILSAKPDNGIAGEQIEKTLFNIFNGEHYYYIPYDPDNTSIRDKFLIRYAKYLLIGKNGVKLFENNADIILNGINDYVKRIGEINIPHIDDFTSEINKKSETIIKNAGVAREIIKPHLKMVLNIFELIKNTILNLLNFTSDGYRDLIWNDRSMKVDDKGRLVDHIERISQEILINFIRQQNEKTLKSYSTVIGPGITEETNKMVNSSIAHLGKRYTKGGKSKKRRRSGKRKTRRKQKKRKTRRKRRCKK